LHEGVLAYLHQKNGWLPVYACVADMPVETAEVFLLCVGGEGAEQSKRRMLDIALLMQAGLQAELMH